MQGLPTTVPMAGTSYGGPSGPEQQAAASLARHLEFRGRQVHLEFLTSSPKATWDMVGEQPLPEVVAACNALGPMGCIAELCRQVSDLLRLSDFHSPGIPSGVRADRLAAYMRGFPGSFHVTADGEKVSPLQPPPERMPQADVAVSVSPPRSGRPRLAGNARMQMRSRQSDNPLNATRGGPAWSNSRGAAAG